MLVLKKYTIISICLFIVLSLKSFAVLTAIPGLDAPAQDSIIFYDYSTKQYRFLTAGSGITITDTIISSSGGAGVTDGDKGDIIISDSGNMWTVDSSTVATIYHEHDFSEITNLPATNPLDVAAMSIPVGLTGGTLSHSITFGQAYYILKVRASAQNYVLSLLNEGISPTDAQLEAINNFFQWSDTNGFVSGNKSGARLLLPVWNDIDANLINLLDADNTTTKARAVNPAGFTLATGSMKTDMAAGSKGFIVFDSTSNLAWDATDWCMAYYSHLAAQTTDNAIIGGRDDSISGGTYRYINTSTATLFRWSPGSTSGSIDYVADTASTFGLIYIGYKGTKIDILRKKAAGVTVGLDTTGSYSAALTNVPMMALAYNSEGGPTSFSGQPVSLLYFGRKIADDATESITMSEAFFNLAVGCGAPST